MSVYNRDTESAVVRWDPPNTSAGKNAVESVMGSVDSFPVDVTDEQAEQIREEYRRLVEETTGGSS